MLAPPPYARPIWLPLRLLLSGAAMASLLMLANGSEISDVVRLLLALPLNGTEEVDLGARLAEMGRTLILTSGAGLVAVCAAMTFTATAVRFGAVPLRWVGVCGRWLTVLPWFGLVWAWTGWYVGSEGAVIETFLPDHGMGDESIPRYGRTAWWWLAPMSWLSLCALGWLMSTLADAIEPSRHADLMLGLRGRGLHPARIQDLHLLPRVWKAWSQRISGLGFSLFAAVIVIESVLQFPGWGAFMARALQAHDSVAIANAVYAIGWMSAIWVALFPRVLTLGGSAPVMDPMESDDDADFRDEPHAHSQVLRQRRSRQTDGLAALVCLGGFILLAWKAESVWLPSCIADLTGVAESLVIAILLGPVLAALRMTILGRSLRRLGILETFIWSPVIVWVLAWTHVSGGVIPFDQAMGLVGAVFLAVELHAFTLRAANQRHLLTAKALGAGPLRAWYHHALLGWLQDLVSTMLWLAAGAFTWRVLAFALVKPTAEPVGSSLGHFLSAASVNALHDGSPLLLGTAVTSVSALFLWSVSRIIKPNDEL